jgi:hypothetical protein
MKNYDDSLGNHNECGHKDRIGLGEDDEAEDEWECADVDYFVGIFEEVFRIGAGDPVFFVNCKYVNDSAFELEKAEISFVA